MGTRAPKALLVLTAAVGGVLWWQRRNETPPTPPGATTPDPMPTRLRASEPFLDPVAERPVTGAPPVEEGAAMPTADALLDADQDPTPPDVRAGAIPPAGTPPLPQPPQRPTPGDPGTT